MSTMQRAIEARLSFTTQHRLRFADGAYQWVVSSAVPSLSPLDGAFMGFIGSVTMIDPHPSISTMATIGTFAPPEPNPITLPSSHAELVIDHLLLARSLLSPDDAETAAIVQAIDLVLYLQGQMLPEQ